MNHGVRLKVRAYFKSFTRRYSPTDGGDFGVGKGYAKIMAHGRRLESNGL